MLKNTALPAFLFLVLFCIGTRPVLADIYKYVSEEGVTSFTDNLESVPEKYRATAVNTTALEEQNRIRSQPQAQPQAQAEQPVQPDAMKFTTRLLMTAGVVFGSFVILVALNKTGDFKGREKVLQATRISLACIFLAYLVMVHAKDVEHLFTMTASKIEAVGEKQAQRGKKAGQAIKALNQLMDAADKQPPAPDHGEEKDN